MDQCLLKKHLQVNIQNYQLFCCSPYQVLIPISARPPEVLPKMADPQKIRVIVIWFRYRHGCPLHYHPGEMPNNANFYDTEPRSPYHIRIMIGIPIYDGNIHNMIISPYHMPYHTIFLEISPSYPTLFYPHRKISAHFMTTDQRAVRSPPWISSCWESLAGSSIEFVDRTSITLW